MIYLVSKNKSLFGSKRYKEVTLDKAIRCLLEMSIVNVQLDTETTGLDEHTKKILTIQLGNKKNQFVFDWTTLTLKEKQQLKEYIERDDILLLGWNLMFDLRFLYSVNIWPKHVWDGYIGQKLIWLGYSHEDLVAMFLDQGEDPIYAGYSLKADCHNYCNIDLDKSVRGKIINEGLTEEVVVYAAGDVMYIEDIKNEMDKILDAQELQTAMFVECEFIKSLAYFQYCGVLLDVDKWKAKMVKDLANMKAAEDELNKWVIEWEARQDEKYEIRYPELEEEGNDIAIDKLTNKLLK